MSYGIEVSIIKGEGNIKQGVLPVRHDHCAIFECLFHGVVSSKIVVMCASPQNCKFLIEVSVDEWEQRKNRKQDIRNERSHDSGESGCEANDMVLAPDKVQIQ